MRIKVSAKEYEAYRNTLLTMSNEDNDGVIIKTLTKFGLNPANLKFKKQNDGSYEAILDETDVVSKFNNFNTSGGVKTLHMLCKKILSLPDFITKTVTRHFTSTNINRAG